MVKTRTHKPTSNFRLRSIGASLPNIRIIFGRAFRFLMSGRRASTTILGHSHKKTKMFQNLKKKLSCKYFKGSS